MKVLFQTPPLYGRPTKPFFRGECISAGSRKKRDSLQQKSELLTQLRSAEMHLLRSPTIARVREVVSVRNRIKSLDMSTISKSMLWSRFFEYANKPHRMLVHKLKPRPYLSIPDHLVQPDGTPTYCPQSMYKVFGEFYNKLYNCLSSDPMTQFTQEKFDSFISSLQLPQLSPDQRSSLNAPITAEELADVIKLLPSHKTPAPDGLPYSYYKAFLPTLSPHMLNLFASLLKGTLPHPQFLHAHITVILKPNKVPSIPDN